MKDKTVNRYSVCGWGGTCGKEEGEWELHIHIQNRTKKPLAIAISGVGRESRGRDGEGDLNNVQCKAIQNCQSESPVQ
jgi:hypothetical protein